MDYLRKLARWFAVIAMGLVPAAGLVAASSVSVAGFGLFGNAELRNSLRLLELDEEVISSNKIDDGAFLILTRLTQNGYLDASVSAEFETREGEMETASWTLPFDPQIAEGVSTDKLHYIVDAGMLYYYDQIEIKGLASIEEAEAMEYFLPGNALFSSKKDRSYSSNNLSGHMKQLTAALNRLGRMDAKVSAESIDINRDEGAVDIEIVVNEGPLYKVANAEIRYTDGEDTSAKQLPVEDQTYSRIWVEDQMQEIRNDSYRLGYPDTRITHRFTHADTETDIVLVDLLFEVSRGPKIILSGVEHIGATNTHQPMLQRKASLEVGEPLDITEVEAARRRLSRLQIFRRIELSYEPNGEGMRKAVFNYTKGRRTQVQLLGGYGSYEQFRAGLIARRENLFGRAHSASFSAIMSAKSLSGSLQYQVPELLGESVNGSLEASYLDREELSFDRTEQGVTFGLSKNLAKLRTDLGLEYAFERKRSSEPQSTDIADLQDTNIGSISLRATHNTLDNILYPRSGYEISGAFRVANPNFGGEAEFIRPELGLSYHKRLGSRWLFHLATKGGLVTAEPEIQSNIPTNEQFLVGGENSLRGYRRGEAGPFDPVTGIPSPADGFAQLSMEMEYPIFDKLNIVFFSDSARIWDIEGEDSTYEDLFSVGIGFRYNTIVGPVRLEYGHNIDPRPTDPEGTLHLSVGFPF